MRKKIESQHLHFLGWFFKHLFIDVSLWIKCYYSVCEGIELKLRRMRAKRVGIFWDMGGRSVLIRVRPEPDYPAGNRNGIGIPVPVNRNRNDF